MFRASFSPLHLLLNIQTPHPFPPACSPSGCSSSSFLLPPPLPHLQPVLSLLAPKLTSLDISAQSNTLKLFQPQLKQFSKLTSLRWGGGRVYG